MRLLLFPLLILFFVELTSGQSSGDGSIQRMTGNNDFHLADNLPQERTLVDSQELRVKDPENVNGIPDVTKMSPENLTDVQDGFTNVPDNSTDVQEEVSQQCRQCKQMVQLIKQVSFYGLLANFTL